MQDIELKQTVEGWVENKCQEWRNHYESNYAKRFDEYYRLWRGVWSSEDQERKQERSKLIAPALQQAVESNVAEIEEATFGKGQWFDIKDNHGDPNPEDMQPLRTALMEEFDNCEIRQAIGEVLINAAVYGTGCAEIVLDEYYAQKPTQKPIAGGLATMYGVSKELRTGVRLKPHQPQNFLVEPSSTNVRDALGVCIDELVSPHYVKQMQNAGIYDKDAVVGDYHQEQSLEPTKALNEYSITPDNGRVRLTKYYGLVPEEFADQLEGYDKELHNQNGYIESVIVVANGEVLLKAQVNPYFMQDRPVIAFAWDVVPSRFWGRGVCEKGYNSQKALDAEIRARIDALALTVHPMMKMKASSLTRGFDKSIYPGKIWLTTNDPQTDLLPVQNQTISQINFAQAQSLQQMVQQATGAVDSAGIAGQVNGEATAAGISMSLGAIIKRHKRTLINFQQSFLIPFVKKAAYRYMQFEPKRFPANDYNFTVSGSLGIIAREYEVTQMTQLLQTMPPDSPMYPLLIESIVEHMSLTNREELLAALKKANQPNPQAEQAALEQQEIQKRQMMAQIAVFEGQAQKDMASAQKTQLETQLLPKKLQVEVLKASTTNLEEGTGDEKEFENRYRLAELLLKEKSIEATIENNRLTAALKANQGQQQKTRTQSAAEKALMKRLGVESDTAEGAESALAKRLNLDE
jgi:hypothetical protein